MANHTESIIAGRFYNRPHILVAWLKLAMGIGWVVFFMYVIGPLILKVPGFSSMSGFIEKQGIKATALYYTDIDEFAEADTTLRHNFGYYKDQLTASHPVGE